jgi:hypothetical protein
LTGVARRYHVTQFLEPRQLVDVVRIVERSSVRYVTRHHAHAAAGRGDEASFGIIVTESARHVLDAESREDGDAVPLPLAVVRAFVTEVAQRGGREFDVVLFGLLDQDHVGTTTRQPRLDTPESRGQ